LRRIGGDAGVIRKEDAVRTALKEAKVEIEIEATSSRDGK
jgi:hypothetical protein